MGIDHVGVGASTHGAVTVEVGTHAHVVYAHDVDGMFEMAYHVHYSCLRSILAQEPVVERGVGHATLRGKRAHLVISEVARHVAQCPAVAV